MCRVSTKLPPSFQVPQLNNKTTFPVPSDACALELFVGSQKRSKPDPSSEESKCGSPCIAKLQANRPPPSVKLHPKKLPIQHEPATTRCVARRLNGQGEQNADIASIYCVTPAPTKYDDLEPPSTPRPHRQLVQMHLITEALYLPFV
jgi:hypothetical protein